jgi:aminoglycoside phosphotransferase family enzyme
MRERPAGRPLILHSRARTDRTRARVAALLARPSTWAASGAGLEVVETHMSTVYLVGDQVYKRKKPVRFIGHDYRSVHARLASCRREVEVNRRLAPETYLGIVAVTERPDGTVEVGGAGRPIDWLVHMRRVPIERTLERGLCDGWAAPADLAAVGDRLAQFYLEQPLVPRRGGRWVRELLRANRDHAAALHRIGVDAAPVTDRIAASVRAQRGLVKSRAARLVHGHGDLRPEHVVLVRPPVFIDALDIAGYRVDPVDELGHLALECELLGADWALPPLLEPWRRLARDPAPAVLVELYQAYRAALRAHLYAVRLWEHRADASPDERARWTRRMQAYLDAGARHAAAL